MKEAQNDIQTVYEEDLDNHNLLRRKTENSLCFDTKIHDMTSSSLIKTTKKLVRKSDEETLGSKLGKYLNQVNSNIIFATTPELTGTSTVVNTRNIKLLKVSNKDLLSIPFITIPNSRNYLTNGLVLDIGCDLTPEEFLSLIKIFSFQSQHPGLRRNGIEKLLSELDQRIYIDKDEKGYFASDGNNYSSVKRNESFSGKYVISAPLYFCEGGMFSEPVKISMVCFPEESCGIGKYLLDFYHINIEGEINTDIQYFVALKSSNLCHPIMKFLCQIVILMNGIPHKELRNHMIWSGSELTKMKAHFPGFFQ
jgi:hypothetical protein